MTDSDGPVPATQEILDALRRRVEERRAAGQYPADLPERMAAHFDRLLRQRGGLTQPGADQELDAALGRAREAGAFAVEKIPTDSRLPGGGLVHRALGRVTARSARGVLDQVQGSTDTIRGVLDLLTLRIRSLEHGASAELAGLDQRQAEEELAFRSHRREVARISADTARLDARLEARTDESVDLLGEVRAALHAVDKRVQEMESRLDDLGRRMSAAERSADRSGFRPWFAAEDFESHFRGTRAEVLDRYRDVVRHLFWAPAIRAERAPVLDIGCGRGEFLELLKEARLDAYGIEIDGVLVGDVKARGLRAVVADAVGHLEKLPDESLGGVVLLQVIEHLTVQEQLDVVSLASRKLRVGGRLLIETVNPVSLYVYAHAMYLDPTHTQPVHPHYLTFLAEQAGFVEVNIEYRSPVPSSAVPLAGRRTTAVPTAGPAAAGVPGDAGGDAGGDAAGDAGGDSGGDVPEGKGAAAGPIDANLLAALERLDHLLYSPQDYLIVATR